MSFNHNGCAGCPATSVEIPPPVLDPDRSAVTPQAAEQSALVAEQQVAPTVESPVVPVPVAVAETPAK